MRRIVINPFFLDDDPDTSEIPGPRFMDKRDRRIFSGGAQYGACLASLFWVLFIMCLTIFR